MREESDKSDFRSSMDFYREDVDLVLKKLGTREEGLSAAEAASRLLRDGPNELASKKSRRPLELLLDQFKNFLIIILLAAAIVSAVVGSPTDALVIVLIVVLAALLGFLQEHRAGRDIEALKEMTAPTATVLRDGVELEIPARELVVGDILVLRTGDRVAADCRLVEAFNLRVDESALTGESVTVEKNVAPIREKTPLGNRRNMVFMGTTVREGRGKGVVTATGMRSEFGAIGGMLSEIEVVRTPLQKNLDRLGRWIGILTLLVVGAVSLVGVLRGYGIIEMFVWGVALAVAAVPEALPAVVTVSLALGVRRMAKRHALVRQLPAVETLGSTTVICTDKTGTLTENKMTVRQIYADQRRISVTGVGYVPEGLFLCEGGVIDASTDTVLRSLLVTGALCNDSSLSRVDGEWRITGDPTEAALVVAAAKAGLVKSDLESSCRRVNEVSFSSERKYMITIHQTPEGYCAHLKGAPEVVLDLCTACLRSGGVESIGSRRDEILGEAHEMAENGLRVIALAYKVLQNPDDEINSGFILSGLVGMIDPPRKEAEKAIKTCTNAGIKTVIITGDHISTAKAVASELGLFSGRERILSGEMLDEMDDEEFAEIVEDVTVYARTSPHHKLRVIDALQRKGHVVAMTGDGVNDAPALKKADIGVAMGITGTDVSKEASDMILTDDNFASIVSAVEEGRNIFKNIRNFITYGLAIHIAEVLIVLATMLAGLPLPLIAIQILWINLVTDGLPPLTLSLEPPDKSIMERPPREKSEGIITSRVLFYSSLIGVVMTVQAIVLFLWRIDDLVRAQSIVFTLVVLSSMFNALNWRSEDRSILKLNPFSNMSLWYAITATLLLQLAVLYTPLRSVFYTTPLSTLDWAWIILLSTTTLITGEIIKHVESKRISS
ncbi:Potassium-transporting ATPase ATP-binding subunit [Candidatus Methanoperedenaceae archaeon GB37]|nr:Potassium-transporting ATPase ATP-binding subunit [Candidatus Methanoperedenaceae archaeon GB37]